MSRAAPTAWLLVLAACRSVSTPDAAPPPCPAVLLAADITRAREALAALGEGTHEVPVGDGRCFRLQELRTASGARDWQLFAVDGSRRLRMRVVLGFRDQDPDLCAKHLERPNEWVVGSAWTEYAETIKTCRDEPDGDVSCAGSAVF